jgi:hypothetical protein
MLSDCALPRKRRDETRFRGNREAAQPAVRIGDERLAATVPKVIADRIAGGGILTGIGEIIGVHVVVDNGGLRRFRPQNDDANKAPGRA